MNGVDDRTELKQDGGVTQLRWWVAFAAYGGALLVATYLLGEALQGVAYWTVTGAVTLAGVAGGAFIHRLRIKALPKDPDGG